MDVFISYARSTEARARVVAEALRGRGYGVWMDDQLPAHRAYADVIEERLNGAKAVLVLWSADAAKSEWVRSEAGKAREQRKLVQAALEPVTLPMPFDQIQCASLANWTPASDSAAWRGILASLDELVHGRAGPASVSPAAPSNAPPRWRPRYALWIAIVLLANVFGLGWWSMHGHSVSMDTQRTAVLDFDAPRGDVALANLADGISDSILSTMGAMQLPLVSRAETQALPAAERLSRARALGGRFLIDGDLRRDGANVAVTARLEDLANGTTPWTTSLSGPAGKPEQLRTQVAAQVIDTLRCATQGQRGTVSEETLALMLSVCNRKGGNSGDPAALRRIAEMFPDSAQSQASYAIGLVQRAEDAPPIARAGMLKDADTAVRRAKSLDPKLGDVYYAEYDLANARGAPRPALEAIELKGLAAEPNHPSLNSQYAGFLRSVGRTRESVDYARLGLERDPLSPVKPLTLAWALDDVGKTAEARTLLAGMAERWPSVSLWRRRLRLAMFAGDRAEFDRLLTEPPEDARGAAETACQRGLWTALAAARSGHPPADGAARVQSCVDAGVLGEFPSVEPLAALGATDAAYAVIDRLAAGGNGEWTTLLFLRQAAPLRRDPRFAPLLRQVGLVAYWRTSRKWPDFCQEPGVAFDCRKELGPPR